MQALRPAQPSDLKHIAAHITHLCKVDVDDCSAGLFQFISHKFVLLVTQARPTNNRAVCADAHHHVGVVNGAAFFVRAECNQFIAAQITLRRRQIQISALGKTHVRHSVCSVQNERAGTFQNLQGVVEFAADQVQYLAFRLVGTFANQVIPVRKELDQVLTALLKAVGVSHREQCYLRPAWVRDVVLCVRLRLIRAEPVVGEHRIGGVVFFGVVEQVHGGANLVA